jgi:hypothetical protein
VASRAGSDESYSGPYSPKEVHENVANAEHSGWQSTQLNDVNCICSGTQICCYRSPGGVEAVARPA